MSKPRFASVWLGGCSGCHMSFLDMDEWLFELAEMVDVVYSPIVDIKEFPPDVDITLVEGAVANEDNVEVARWGEPRAFEFPARDHVAIGEGLGVRVSTYIALRSQNTRGEFLTENIAGSSSRAALPSPISSMLTPCATKAPKLWPAVPLRVMLMVSSGRPAWP